MIRYLEIHRILLMQNISNNMDFVEIFEDHLCQYTNFKFAVCTDSCTDALMISLESKRILGQISKDTKFYVPKHTYLSVPMTLARNGWRFQFIDNQWHGSYSIGNFIIDAATDFRKDLGITWKDVEECAVCVSFQQKKRLNLDQGGVIFTNSEDISSLCRRLRHDGRDPKRSHVDEVQNDPENIILGWHAYMSPEKAARGILAMNQIQLLPPYVQHSWEDYPDVSTLKCFDGVAEK